MVPRSRRALLASVGATSGLLSGCLGQRNGIPIGDNGSGSGERVVDISPVAVRKMILEDFEIWGDVRVASGQFLLVRLHTADGPFGVPSVDEVRDFPLDVVLDDERLGVGPRKAALVPPDVVPTNPERLETHAIALPVPVVSTDSAAVVLDRRFRDVRRHLDDAIRNRLAAAPMFEVRDVTFRPVEDGVEATVAVANVGDRDGRCLFQFSLRSANDLSEVVSRQVPAGETVTISVRPRVLAAAGTTPGSRVTIQLWSTSHVEREVTFPSRASTNTSTSTE